MFPLTHLPEARDDVDAAYTDYEQRQVGLGDRFLGALLERTDAVRDILALPGLYP